MAEEQGADQDPAARQPAAPDDPGAAPDDPGGPRGPGGATEDAGAGAPARPKPSRTTLFLLIVPIVLVSVMGLLATAFTPTLSTQHPLLLIALDARNRFLILAREVDLVPFLVVAVLRRTLSDPLFYLLGRFYGDGAVRWLEKKGGGGQLVVLTERLFKRASYPMVFLFPGAIVCALAGATGMNPIGFVVTNVAGTITAVLAVRIFSASIASPVEAVLGFFRRHLLLTTSITVGLVVLSVVLNWYQGKLDAADLDELEQGVVTKPAEGDSSSDSM
jgi:membrane protein DedA with SNARE-associated domain